MKLSHSFEEGYPEERDAAEARSDPGNSAGRDDHSQVKGASGARILFVELVDADIARICYGIPPDLCDVAVIEDAEEAAGSIGDCIPDLVVCPQDAWCAVSDRVGQALARADMRRPVLVLLLPAAGGEWLPMRSAAATIDPHLLQSIRSVIRLVLETRRSDAAKTLAHAGITLDPVTHRVTRGDRPVRLSQTTFQLLHVLMAEPERVHTREELLRSLRGERIHVAVRTIDVHIKRLRKELNIFGGPDVIRTVRGVGYAFSHDPWTR